MEKIRAYGKNEMYDDYFKAVKAKLDEIVDFVNAIDISGYVPGQDLPPEYGGERPTGT